MRAFRHRPFRIFWAGAFASNTGTWLSNLAVPYVLFEITHSALWVGIAALLQLAPQVLFAPLGGALADRHNRRLMLLVTQAGMAVSALVLWGVWIAGVRNPWAIGATIGLSGMCMGINLPGWQSFVNDLVPREDLISAVALNSLQFNGARAIGPAIAGVVLALLGPSWAFLLNAASFVFVIGALLALGRHVEQPAARPAAPGVLSGFASAWRYARTQPGIQVAIWVSVLIGFVGNPIFTFTVVFASEVFKVGAVGLGLMNAALGVGSLVAAPLVAGGRLLTKATITAGGVVLFGVAELAFGVSPAPVLGALTLLVVGGCFLAVISSANTAMQLIVADHVRGRVLAVRIVLFTASLPLGSLAQGWISDQIGPRATVTGAGAVLVLVGLFLALWRRGVLLRRLDDPHDESAPDAEPVAG